MTNHTDIGTETLEEHCCHGWSCQNQSEQPFAQLHQLHQLRIDPLLTMYSGPSIPLRTLNVQAAAAKRTSIAIAIGVVLILLGSVLFGEWMTMSIGMVVHEASILVVILNGMRLLRYR